jgi:hypothetical protein
VQEGGSLPETIKDGGGAESVEERSAMVAQSGKRRGVGWSIAAGWLLLVVAFGGAFIALIGWAQEGKTASPAAPYWERLFPLAIVSVVLALLFAAWVSDAAWTPAFRARRAFVLFGASVAVLFGVGLATVKPQRSHVVRYVGDARYEVPRLYVGGVWDGRPGDSGFQASLCPEDLSPYWGPRRSWFLRPSPDECEMKSIALATDAEGPYDLGVTVPSDPPNGRWRTLDGWTVIDLDSAEFAAGARYESEGLRYVVLGATGQPIRSARCRTERDECRVSGWSDLGLLSYVYPSSAPEPAAWLSYEARLLPLLRSWRVEG